MIINILHVTYFVCWHGYDRNMRYDSPLILGNGSLCGTNFKICDS